MSIPASHTLVTLYQLLAETLSEPMAWLASAGKNWELYKFALALSQEILHPPLQKAVVELASVPAESLRQREKRYQNLFAGSTTEPISIYESMALEGRLHGATTFRVWTLYRSVGLHIVGTELPDHISIELAFIAYLVQQELNAPCDSGQWRKARREFIKQHAAKWMPALGTRIARKSDPVYRPIGLLLTAIIQAETSPRRKQPHKRQHQLPKIVDDETCTLCSFCAQVCPTNAIAIHETAQTTTLNIIDNKCVSCNKCVRICPEHILYLEEGQPDSHSRKLYQSPRACCPGCGVPTVSQAEVDAIVRLIGHPNWLDYCSDCRMILRI